MRPDLEDFDELNMEETPRNRLMSWLVLGLAVGSFAALAYYAYHSGTATVQDGEMMTVSADGTPIKEIPLDPEGEKFANKDKTIYDVISPESGAQANVEKLLPEPEKPVTDVREALASAPAAVEEKPAAPVVAAPVPTPAPAPAAATSTPAATTYVKKEIEKPVAAAKTAAPAVAPTSSPVPVAAKPVVVVKKPEPAPAPLISAKPAVPVAEEVTIPASEPEDDGAPEIVNESTVSGEKITTTDLAPEVKEEPAPKKAQAPKKEAKEPTSSGAYQIQLGAYQSEEEARASWKKISGKFSLSGSPNIVKAELPNGTFYRLRTGGFASADAAKAACAKLSAKSQACFPVGK